MMQGLDCQLKEFHVSVVAYFCGVWGEWVHTCSDQGFLLLPSPGGYSVIILHLPTSCLLLKLPSPFRAVGGSEQALQLVFGLALPMTYSGKLFHVLPCWGIERET